MLTKIKNSWKKAKNSLKKFHKDEKGLEALQVILIVAIAAIILALLKWQWPAIRDWFKKTVGHVSNETDTNAY